jgi:hypothetical protein
MHMIPRENALDDVHSHLGASLPDDLPDTLAHRTFQDLVTILRHPNDVKSVIKAGMTARRVGHDLSSRI